jgi:hypothetical protein
MAKMNDVRFMVSSICPADQVAEGDRIYRSHTDWMKATHHREGPKALLSYDVSRRRNSRIRLTWLLSLRGIRSLS